MVKKSYKHTAVLLIMAMLISLCPVSSLASGYRPAEPPEFESVIAQFDGTSSDGVTGQFSLTKDTQGNECFSVGNSQWTRQLFFGVTDGKTADTKYVNDEGRCMISFDVYPKQTDRALILLINDSDSVSWYPFVLNGGGKMYFNEGRVYPTATYLPPNARPYEANTWYNIKMDINTHESYIDFYVNDEYWDRNYVTNSYWLNSLYNDTLTLDKVFFNYQPDWGLDENGRQLPADTSGEILIDNFTYGIPQKRDIELEFHHNEPGNIYDANSVDVGYDITNSTDAGGEYALDYEIRTDKNKLIKKATKSLELKANDTVSVTLLDDAPEYGFFTVEVKLYDASGNLMIRDADRFSVIPHQDGVNDRMGACVHNVGHGSTAYGATEGTLEVLHRLGIGYTRDDYSWSSFYDTTGENRTNSNYMQKNNKLYTESPIGRLVLVRTLPEAYNMKYDANDENVKSFLNRWGKYCYNLASDLPDDVIYYEIENEWWLHGTLGLSGVNYNVNISSDIQLYAEMYKIASQQIKAANPNAKIVAFNASHGNYAWLRDVLDALGDNPGQYFDIIALHDYMAYWGSPFPEQFMQSGDPSRGTGAGGIDEFLTILDEYDIADKPIWSSEFGTTSGYHKADISEKLNADFYVRHFMFDSQFMDKMFIYQLQLDGFPASAYEGGFGIVRQGQVGEIKREALPAAIEFAAYNSLLKGSQFVSKQIIGTDGSNPNSKDIYIYKHITADGKDCYAIFNATSQMTASFDLGVDSAKVYDEYGNETTINAYDGYITLNVTTAPTYVIASDLKEEVTMREAPLFDITREVKSTVDDMFSFEVTKDTDLSVDVSVECSANTEVAEKHPFVYNSSVIDMITYNDIQDVDNYKFYMGENIEQINVKLMSGGKIYYNAPVTVKYIDSLDSDMRIMPYRNGRWQAILSIKNNKRTSPLSGKIDISTGDSEEITNLLSGQKSTIRFNIPEEIRASSYTVDATIYLDDGSVVSDSADTTFISVERAYTPPVIDGELSSGEWQNSGTPISFDSVSQYVRLNPTNSPEWHGEEDLSGEAYLMYDDDYLYLAATVQDDVHCGTDEQDRVWAMDSIQFGVAESQTKTSNYTEIGIALGDDGESKIAKYADANQNDPFFDKATMNIFDDTTEIKATRNGTGTVYELRIPWTELTVSGQKPADYLIFSALINENDGKGRTAFMQWASGIGQGKNPELFAKIPFNN